MTTTSSLQAALAPGFSGALLAPADAGYDAARRVWNAMVDRRPALIARCASTADVVRCVRAAAELGVAPAVRGGGHQVAGFAVCDGGLVIDLSGLRRVEVDRARRRARAGGGCLLGDVDRATQAHGLAAPAGVISHTGLGGLALGGGIGWLCRRHGLTCDNLSAVEIVTADGAVRTASEDEHPELFWAIRGGGGNFGVVTRFDLALHPVREAHVTQLAFRWDDAPDVLRAYAELMAGAPDELVAALALRRDGDPVALVNLVHSGAAADAARLAAAARAWAQPLEVRARTLPFLELQTMQDAQHPHGLRDYMKAGYLPRLGDAEIAALLAAAAGIPSVDTQIEIVYLRGAIARVHEDATAFPSREAAFSVNVVATWRDAAEDERQIGWARAAYDRLAPYLAGGYTNFLGDEQDRVATVYGPHKLARLAAVKRRYDPENRFRHNLNIEPRGELAAA
jgi:FAD/FMN-containing dehydrogenase